MKARYANIADMSFTGQKGMVTDVCVIKQNQDEHIRYINSS